MKYLTCFSEGKEKGKIVPLETSQPTNQPTNPVDSKYGKGPGEQILTLRTSSQTITILLILIMMKKGGRDAAETQVHPEPE